MDSMAAKDEMGGGERRGEERCVDFARGELLSKWLWIGAKRRWRKKIDDVYTIYVSANYKTVRTYTNNYCL